MKTLILVRHAKAELSTAGVDDMNRALIKKGVKAAEKMALSLKKVGIKPDLVISSSAERAYDTARIFAKILKIDADMILKKNELYEFHSGEEFLPMLHAIDNKFENVMIVGHEPTMSELASILSTDFSHDLPTAGVVGIEFKKRFWKQVAAGTGKLSLLLFPMSKSKKALVDKKIAQSSANPN